MTALHGLAAATFVACLSFSTAPLHAQPDFGDNSSRWADDGECDDPRFEGEGSAATLLEDDLGHDAADCRALLEQGRIALRSEKFGGDALVRRGRLEEGDDTLDSGEYADHYTFTGSAGQRAETGSYTLTIDVGGKPELIVRLELER